MGNSLNTRVLIHLMKYGKITSKDAFKLYGNTRLSSSIYELRSQGYPIETVMIDGLNRYHLSRKALDTIRSNNDNNKVIFNGK